MAYALYGMPLLIHATAWWLGGLFADAWWSVGVPWIGLLVAAVVMGRTHRVEPLLLPVALLVAWGSRTERQRCTALVHTRLVSRAPVWFHVTVMDTDTNRWRGRRPSVARGTLAETRRYARCRVPATVHFAAGDSTARRLAPGRIAALEANALSTATGLRLSDARVSGIDPRRNPLVAWRATLGGVIDAHFRTRAPLVRALLIADQQGIPPDVRDRYADAGLVHMLSVSGMHVAIIASALLTLGGAARLPRRWLDPLAMTLVAAYIALLGCPAPAVRSGVMLAVMSLSRQWQRPVHEWTALALGAVVPTVDPLVVHDLGWQLSVGGMAALVAARSLRRRWKIAARSNEPPRRTAGRIWRWLMTRRGVAGWLITEALTGVVATIVTLPIIAWTFGRVSVIAPLSNIVAGPVVGGLQPALFAALLWALVAPATVGTWVADATQPLMALLDGIAAAAASLPGAVWPVAPTLVTAVGMGTAAALVVRGTAARRGTPWYVAALGAAVAAVWWPLLAPTTGEFEMHVLDVGQGDAIALRTPRGRWMLVDAGRRWQGGDAGRRTVVPYIRRRGGEVALFVLSHPHDDHAGGAASAVHALRPRLWWEPAFVTSSPGYRDALAAVRAAGTLWRRVRPGQQFLLDGVTLTVLAPDSLWTAAQHDANETSIVVRVAYGRTRFLLTGDAERNEEDWLLARYPAEALRADVLKLGHHGSRTSSSPGLLDAVAPQLAIASVGAGNRYGHPAPETLQALLARGIPAMRTDLDGTIVVRSNGQRVAVETHADRWILPGPRGVR